MNAEVSCMEVHVVVDRASSSFHMMHDCMHRKEEEQEEEEATSERSQVGFNNLMDPFNPESI